MADNFKTIALRVDARLLEKFRIACIGDGNTVYEQLAIYMQEIVDLYEEYWGPIQA